MAHVPRDAHEIAHEIAHDTIIELRDLHRRFTRRSDRGLRRTKTSMDAVDGISLSVRRGEIVGWLGPNGAGKSTTIKMCTGILVPTSGTVRVVGLDPVAQRRELARRIGVVFGQRSQRWWDLPLGDSFELLHRIHRTGASEHEARLAGLVAMLDVAALVEVPVRQLSLGQRMRGELVAALLHGPELLFLDEPTIGLDVVSKHAVREGLFALRRDNGVTIVLTTHDLGDVRRLCDRVTVMEQGRIALDTTLDGLMARSGARRRVITTFDDEAAPLVSSFTGAELISTEGPRAVFEVDLERTSMADALSHLSSVARLADLVVEERDIEAVVRELYGRR